MHKLFFIFDYDLLEAVDEDPGLRVLSDLEIVVLD
jgi:hypothetical protein